MRYMFDSLKTLSVDSDKLHTDIRLLKNNQLT